jgi:hypothetical protein
MCGQNPEENNEIEQTYKLFAKLHNLMSSLTE